jgi:hypothetical protein
VAGGGHGLAGHGISGAWVGGGGAI